MQPRRMVSLLMAIVMCGLGIVALAPAPPAAAAYTSFSQTSLDLDAVNGVCTTDDGIQYESSWMRRFHLDDLATYGAFVASSVSFGASQLTVAPGKDGVPVRVRAYRYPATDATLTWAELQEAPFKEVTYSVTAQDREDGLITVVPSFGGLFGTFDPSTEDAVVEIHYAGGLFDERFTAGANNLPETQPGYFRYAGCSGPDGFQPSEIHSMDSWNLQGTNVVITLNGENGIDSDQDGDRVPDNPDRDACPTRYGLRVGAHPGCPSFVQALTAVYDAQRDLVTGTVTLAGHDGVSCLGPVKITVLDGNGVPLDSTMTTSGTSRAFEIDRADIDDGTSVALVVEEYVDTDAQGASLAECRSSSARLTVGSRDVDADGLRDADDACVHVKGDVQAGYRPGCPRLAQQVSAEHVGDAVAGTVSVQRSAAVPAEACAGPVTVELFRIGADNSWESAGSVESSDGSYSLAVGDPQDGTEFVVRAFGYDTPELAVCLRDDSDVVEVVRDQDDDEWRDLTDRCDAVRFPGSSVAAGCPDLARRVTSSYADGRVTGTVSFTAGDVPATACVKPEHTQVRVVEFLASGGGQVELKTLATGHYAPTDGTYDLAIDLPVGRFFHVEVLDGLDPDAGWCGSARTAPSRVPEPDGDRDGVSDDVDSCPTVAGDAASGCPTVARSVTATYADGAITGQVSVVGPSQAAAGTCLATEVTAFYLRDGVPVQVGPSAVASLDGSFGLRFGGVLLAPGTTYFVRIGPHRHGQVADCGAAESARRVTPVPAIDPPGGAGPVVELVAPALTSARLSTRVIHVAGSATKPRRTRLRVRLNVETKVVLTFKGLTFKGTGKRSARKVRATMSKMLPAGPSSTWLSGAVGGKRLPPGTYEVRLRATNSVGSASASAGRLTIRP